MNENDFKAELSSNGYTDMETQNLEPRPAKGRHRHHFAVRGLVLSGNFIVTLDEQPIVYGPGQIFSVAAGQLHDEAIGPDGARVVIGRKHPSA